MSVRPARSGEAGRQAGQSGIRWRAEGVRRWTREVMQRVQKTNGSSNESARDHTQCIYIALNQSAA